MDQEQKQIDEQQEDLPTVDQLMDQLIKQAEARKKRLDNIQSILEKNKVSVSKEKVAMLMRQINVILAEYHNEVFGLQAQVLQMLAIEERTKALVEKFDLQLAILFRTLRKKDIAKDEDFDEIMNEMKEEIKKQQEEQQTLQSEETSVETDQP